MSSFYEKLSTKFQEGEVSPAGEKDSSPSKSITYRATGDRAAPSVKEDTAVAGTPPMEQAPEGTEPIDVDLFQSDSRMVVFMQAGGIPANGFMLTISEESNTLTVEAAQKRPDLPPLTIDVKPDTPAEKGIYTKQEIKWKSLYRKIYLPASFDGSGATAVIEGGVLVITLPAKHPGVGKKLTVKEIRQEEHTK